MEYACRMVTPFGLGIAKHIKRDSVADIFPGAHAVDGFLHLVVTTVTAFHGVGSRREQLIVEEGECLFQVGAEEFLEGTCRSSGSGTPVGGAWPASAGPSRSGNGGQRAGR